MRVCFCPHRLPYPPVAGGRTETFRLIVGLAEHGHEVSVVTYGDDRALADEMEREAGCTVDLVPGTTDRSAANLLGNLLSPDPLPVTKTRGERYERAVTERVRSADVLHLHALQPSYLAREFERSIPTVIRFNNVKYEIYRQFARRSRNPAKAAYAYLQFLKSRRYERGIPAAADLTPTITDADRTLLAGDSSGSNIQVLQAGVDVDRFRSSVQPEDDIVTFFGSMDYHPNDEAARWFARRVFPRLRKRRPDVEFQIVGKNPSAAVERLGRTAGITVTGFVDDIADAVGRATVVVIPIRVGTGIRMKVLHAMAMGKPIVSTPLGVQGINAVEGTHVAIAETAGEFAAKVNDLLGDPSHRAALGSNARELVERDHDWETIVDQLEGYYTRLLATPTGAG